MGLLGAYIPYEPAKFTGKVGTWCNKRDVMCSSKFSISDHTAYVSDNLYEDAAKRIFTKITDYFGVPNTAFSPHDTAFLIDSTGSMEIMIEEYKDEIIRLAKETIEIGGRIALYDFKDLEYHYQPKEHCNFENCTLEKFTDALLGLKPYEGGDPPESVLSAAYHAMNQLHWQFGATKSIILLTDNYYLNPDRDGIVLSDVVNLSKQIDPVNFYPIVPPRHKGYYRSLVEGTDGKASSSVEEFHDVVNLILARNDSLPRVEESEAVIKPSVIINTIAQVSEDEMKIEVDDAEQVVVILNDTVLGITDQHEIVIGDLDRTITNTISLVPIIGGIKGEIIEVAKLEPIEVVEPKENAITESESIESPDITDTTSTEEADTPKMTETAEEIIMNGRQMNKAVEILSSVDFLIPKAPNTGRK